MTQKNESLLSFETRCIHPKSILTAKSITLDPSVVPPLYVSINFDRNSHEILDNILLNSEKPENSPGQHIYSRESTPLRDLVESMIAATEGEGYYALMFSSAMSAASVLLSVIRPNIVVHDCMYTGTLEILSFLKIKTMTTLELDNLEQGDLLWLESPDTPLGNLQDIQALSTKAHERGALVMIDGTIAPPPLQNALSLGCDIVLHSLGKFYGGHSDLMAGALVMKSEELYDKVRTARTTIGSIPGSLETWLVYRSLKTLSLRVKENSKNAAKFARWLFENRQKFEIENVHHIGYNSVPLSMRDKRLLEKQMPVGGTSVFSIAFKEAALAKALPFLLKLFHNTSSLGSVESLVDYRYRPEPSLSSIIPQNMLRFSIGLENVEDLKRDFEQAIHEYRTNKDLKSKL